MNSDRRIINTMTRVAAISNNSKLKYDQKLSMILQEIIECMRSQKGSIMLTRGRQNLEVVAATNPAIVGARQPLSEDSPSTWVVKNKKPLYIDHKTPNPFAGRYKHYKTEAFLLAPIMNENKVAGVISITERIGNDEFSQDEQITLFNMAGYVIGTIEKKRLAEKILNQKRSLEKKNRQLEKLEELRTELFNMLIHDLKGPISEIVANLDILSYVVAEDNKDFVHSSQSACDTLYRMVTNLLDIARLEDGSMPIMRENIAPWDLLRELLSRQGGSAEAKGVTITIPEEPQEQPRFIGDRGILIRVLQNLIMNAIRFSPEGGTIAVDFKYSDNRITFTVTDNGPGVAPEMQQAIFDKYVQGAQKSDGRQYTTGLGLSFCRLAVEAHKGRIRVISDGRNGSCFTFWLPANPPS